MKQRSMNKLELRKKTISDLKKGRITGGSSISLASRPAICRQTH